MALCTIRASLKHSPLNTFFLCLGVIITCSWRASSVGKNWAATCKSRLDWLSVVVKDSALGCSIRRRINPNQLPIAKRRNNRRKTSDLRARKTPNFSKALWYPTTMSRDLFLRPVLIALYPSRRFLGVRRSRLDLHERTSTVSYSKFRVYEIKGRTLTKPLFVRCTHYKTDSWWSHS